ncbi:hypothetical protein QQ045_006591 [Rhodiola kirilowii]
MSVRFPDPPDTSYSLHDPLLPWLSSINNALAAILTSPDDHCTAEFQKLLSDCVSLFKSNGRYRDDVRFLKIWFLYMDGSEDFCKVFEEMEKSRICLKHSLLYETYALLLEGKGMLGEAAKIYQLGISRNAEPIGQMKKAERLFISRMKEILNAGSLVDETPTLGEVCNPWSTSVVNNLFRKINRRIVKNEGYHATNRPYSGKVALSSLHITSRNKIIEIGGRKYQIKGCAGQGGFAKVFKAYVNINPDEVVAMKIQQPPFPWEFYMYRLLDQRIPDTQRSSYGFAHEVHIYSDYSILICDYLSNGTLQDAINSKVVAAQSMEEVLCVYYTTEMLYMLENLHSVGIIHGDFKPDNLLIRYAKDDPIEDEYKDRSGSWRDQGLCLLDWGRGIDLSLFPEETEFFGDCRTSGFRCVEMQEKKPWKFQVDTYGLCVIVHMMLHGSYMEVLKKPSADGGYTYQPKLPFKRYWNEELWKSLFTKLLNQSPEANTIEIVKELRESFQNYMCSNPKMIKNLKQLLAKQRSSLCSS